MPGTQEKGLRQARVVLNLPLDRSFVYRVAPDLEREAQPGARVLVPFRSKTRVGIVVERSTADSDKAGIKPLIRVLDRIPSITSQGFGLASWIRDYYCCSWGQALWALCPFSTAQRISPGIRGNPGARQREPGATGSPPRVLHYRDRQYVREHCLDLVRKCPGQAMWIVPQGCEVYPLKEFLHRRGIEDVAVCSSVVSSRRRHQDWLRMRRGEVRVAVGTRSAVLAPFSRLDLLVVEDEEDGLYKQKESPRYHVREIAAERSRQTGAQLVYTSRSPSLEAWHHVAVGAWHGETVRADRTGPSMQIVDMKRRGRDPLSRELHGRVRDTLDGGQISVVFLNQRGYATFLLCRECGEVARCPRCRIALRVHLEGRLRCHACGWETPVPSYCPNCRGTRLVEIGSGTQRLERRLLREFPAARVLRVDSDTGRARGTLAAAIDRVRHGQVDILVGTQLVLREELLASVHLVGVTLLEASLNLPDFRATERTFHLMQRTYWSMNPEGMMVVQTFNPSHYLVQALQGSSDFYQEEAAVREQLGYPPFAHWERIVGSGPDETKVSRWAEKLGRQVAAAGHAMLGPMRCPYSPVGGRHRHHLLLPTDDPIATNRWLRENLSLLLQSRGGVRVTVDVDPQDVL